MAKTRLLYLKSINDETTMMDIDYISRSVRFERFEVKVCFAILMGTYEKRGSYEIPYRELLRRLEKEIKPFKPQILLLHTGVAFRAKPESFLQALAIIKLRHPKIKIYYERIREYDNVSEPRRPYYSAQITLDQLLIKNDLFSGDERDLLP